MLDAVRPAIDDGRITVFCVSSFDLDSWSASWMPLADRARNHRRYEDWIIWQVVPFIRDRWAAGTISRWPGRRWAPSMPCCSRCGTRTCSAGPSALTGNYDPWSWRAWGQSDDDTYFTSPMQFLPGTHGGHLDYLRSRLAHHPGGRQRHVGGQHRRQRLHPGAGRGAGREADPARTVRLGSGVAARLAELAGAGGDRTCPRWAPDDRPSCWPTSSGPTASAGWGPTAFRCSGTANRRSSTGSGPTTG